ncbi:hypothetical protein [Sinorhizobium sp. BG8]|uniref:hypothetical protein n=1 Tax=Sinorhizobium sp. BG8 TaxID=2613773 RepID=UPI001FEDB5D9|nr:hypothetical protein [Sinorhizobium sp. BG8]
MADRKKKIHFGIDPKTHHLVIGTWRMRLPKSRLWRTVIGSVLIFFGFLGFLPVLGFWMIPLGLLVLSHDSHLVRRQRRRFTVWWAARKADRSRSSEGGPKHESPTVPARRTK